MIELLMVAVVFLLVGYYGPSVVLAVLDWKRPALRPITTMEQVEAEATREWESEYRGLLQATGMGATPDEPWAYKRFANGSNTRFDLPSSSLMYTLGGIMDAGNQYLLRSTRPIETAKVKK